MPMVSLWYNYTMRCTLLACMISLTSCADSNVFNIPVQDRRPDFPINNLDIPIDTTHTEVVVTKTTPSSEDTKYIAAVECKCRSIPVVSSKSVNYNGSFLMLVTGLAAILMTQRHRRKNLY